MFKRKTIAGSGVGGIANTELMLDFCAKHQVFPDVELIEAKQIDEKWDHLMNNNNQTALRFVIDIKKSLANQDFIPKE